jgi:uncharacterized RmlC-like cupin family protein
VKGAHAPGREARIRRGSGAGDFIWAPPFVPHQEINASESEAPECVLPRSGQGPVVVNLDIPVVEKPDTVVWTDNIHPHP